MFAKLLQLQLVPVAVAQNLMASLSPDKKQQLISLHSELLADESASTKSRFTLEHDNALLLKIQCADAACAEGGANGVGCLGRRRAASAPRGHLAILRSVSVS